LGEPEAETRSTGRIESTGRSGRSGRREEEREDLEGEKVKRKTAAFSTSFSSFSSLHHLLGLLVLSSSLERRVRSHFDDVAALRDAENANRHWGIR
jgi:hypothetical protein